LYLTFFLSEGILAEA